MVIFFFQAEDGIRDGTVTGVQTCALAIFAAAPALAADNPPAPATDNPAPAATDQMKTDDLKKPEAAQAPAVTDTSKPAEARSEERRVGKECRSRWSR